MRMISLQMKPNPMALKKNKKGTVVNSYIFEGIFYFLYDSFVSIIFIPL